MTKTYLRRSTALLGLIIVTAVSGCADGTGLPKSGEFDRLANQPITERNPDARRNMSDAVNFFSEPPVTKLEIGGSNAFQLSHDPGQKVPNVVIGKINAAPMTFGALLNQVAEQASMSWRISGDAKTDLMKKEVYLVLRHESPLKTVLDELSELTEAFYKVEGDRIVFSQTGHFVARVPRMADSQEILVSGLSSIGAQNVFSDKLSGTVSFDADRPTYEASQRLMRSLELGRDMIVYDFWLLDRNITDKSGLGVKVDLKNFGELSSKLDDGEFSAGGTAIVEKLFAASADAGLLSGNLGDLGVDAALQLMRGLGKTETVARPTISMLSGAESSFNNGEKYEYIRSVETNSSGDITSSGTDVRQLETGVEINVTGAHNKGVISTDFSIKVSELLAFEEYDTGSVRLRLPKTAERELKAHLEARPGDVMVLGGIIRDTETKERQEVLGTKIAPQRSKSANRTETIILVRPRLVQIRPAHGKAGQGVTSIEPGVGEIAPEANPINKLIVEEDQAKLLVRSLKK